MDQEFGEVSTSTGIDSGDGLVVAGQFRLDRLLGETRGTSTWLGFDEQNDESVVIKAIPLSSLPAGALMRLEHEAALLARVQSPWFPSVLYAGRQRKTFFLVSRYAPGESLQKRLARGPLQIHDAVRIGRGLFSALRDLHREHVLHRGIRATNLIVNEQGPVISAVLVDFGPAHAITAEASLPHQCVEAALYVSPEQAGSIDRDITEASDLYSAGIVLFQCFAGRPPFSGESTGDVLFEHMTARVPELRSLGIPVPRALDELVARLLRKDPRDRYQSAEAVLADLDAIGEGLARGEIDPAVVIGALDRRCTLTDPAFVARGEELESLDAQFAEVRSGVGGLVLIEGESGGGKSWLLAEAAQRATREGLWVLRGQGTGEVAQRPFRLLDGVVEAFLNAAGSRPELADSTRRRLGGHAQAVCAAIPNLSAVLDSEEVHVTAPEAFAETRTVQALAHFLNAIGGPERPVLIILDDCQWADELTYKLIRQWHSLLAANDSARHVLVIAAFRSEEIPEDHLLRRLDPAVHLRLSPFSPPETRRLIESMAGRVPEPAVELVTRLAEGSPFMASAVLRGMIESGALVADAGGWRLEPLAMDSLRPSSLAASLLSRRLELLPRESVQLLATGAVLGKEFELDIAAELACQTPSQAIAAVDEARRRRLAWLRPDGARCVLVHDRIRSALLARMTPEERRELHRRAARDLCNRHPHRISELAYHFDAAGDSVAALPHAIRAAEQARARHALDVAEQQYRIAQRGADGADKRTRYQIAEGLGDVLMLRGCYDAAQPLFEEAARLADGAYTRAQIRGKLGELDFKRGEMLGAIDAFTSALRMLGESVPRRRTVLVLMLVWETLVQALHTAFPSWFVHRRQELPSEAERLSLRLLSNLAHGCWYCDNIRAVWAHLREMNLAERYPPTAELAQAYGEHAPAMSLVAWFRRGTVYAEKAIAIRRSLGDLWGQGQALVYYGIVLYAASRFDECIEKCREAIRLLERLGDFWQVHMARYQLAASLYHLGDHRGAVEQAQLNRKSGLETGDEQASGIILDVWARAAGGNVPEEILQEELQRSRHDTQGIVQVLLAEGVRLLGAGQLARSAAIFEEAISVAKQSPVKNAYTLPVFIWGATAYRRMAEETHDATPVRRLAFLCRADALARRAIRASRLCRNDLPQAHRERGLVLAFRGRTAAARRSFERSLDVARELRARYEHAQTLLARARIGRELDWPEAERDFAEGQLILAELRSLGEADSGTHHSAEPATLSLADRFDTVLDSGRRIASALSPSAIYEEVCAAALRLLRGEHCLVLQVDESSNSLWLTPIAGDSTVQIGKGLVEQAVGAARAVASIEELSPPGNNATASSGERSVLCVPIFARGQAVACLCVTHEQVRGLFGTDEERLADFVATIAGAALENAEGLPN